MLEPSTMPVEESGIEKTQSLNDLDRVIIEYEKDRPVNVYFKI
jgi:hypothetical protein